MVFFILSFALEGFTKQKWVQRNKKSQQRIGASFSSENDKLTNNLSHKKDGECVSEYLNSNTFPCKPVYNTETVNWRIQLLK